MFRQPVSSIWCWLSHSVKRIVKKTFPANERLMTNIIRETKPHFATEMKFFLNTRNRNHVALYCKTNSSRILLTKE